MERSRCPHCGHPSPPPSPGLTLEDGGRRTPPLMDFDHLDSSQKPATPAPVIGFVEPRMADELYRPLWDFLGLTVLSISALILYFFLSPDAFPWYLVVIAFFTFAWTAYHLLRQLSQENVTPQQRTDLLFKMHLLFVGATSMFCLMTWLLTKPMGKPWFIFVFAGSASSIVLHYSVAYLDLKRMWLLPQMQIYFIVICTCYITNLFFNPWDGAWWLYPAVVWGVIILLQVGIFVLITNRRIKLNDIETPTPRRKQTTSRHNHGSFRADPAEVPLLVDFSHGTDDSSPSIDYDKLQVPKLTQRGRTSPPGRKTTDHRPPIHSPVARNKPHTLTIPTPTIPVVVPTPDPTIVVEATDFEPTPLVEYISTPTMPNRLGSTTHKHGRQTSRPISLRVVHHDENSVDVVEGSLASSEGIYIDVVHIPPGNSSNTGFT